MSDIFVQAAFIAGAFPAEPGREEPLATTLSKGPLKEPKGTAAPPDPPLYSWGALAPQAPRVGGLGRRIWLRGDVPPKRKPVEGLPPPRPEGRERAGPVGKARLGQFP